MANNIQSKPLKDIVQRIHKRRFYEALLLGFIRGQVTILKNITIEKSILFFYKEFNIDEDDYPMNACKTSYHRMIKEFYENEKST